LSEPSEVWPMRESDFLTTARSLREIRPQVDRPVKDGTPRMTAIRRQAAHAAATEGNRKGNVAFVAKNNNLRRFPAAPRDDLSGERKPMPTVKLVEENDPNPLVQKIFADIKETKKIDRVPAIWRALATHPPHLEMCWTRLKAIMKPGKIDLLTKEIIALAVSVTTGCAY
jgi:hypothetical protein